MAKRKSQTKPQRRRRVHSDEFKREAVRLVLAEQLTVAEAARNLGIHPNLSRSCRRGIEQRGQVQALWSRWN